MQLQVVLEEVVLEVHQQVEQTELQTLVVVAVVEDLVGQPAQVVLV
jgi:hypothetical protein